MKRTLSPGYTIGTDAYNDIPTICTRFGHKAVIVGGKRALEAAEKKILDGLRLSGLQVTGVEWYGGEASVENIHRLRALTSVQNADMIFAVGGGKAIDTGKVLAQDTNRPLFTFPTIASTCAPFTSQGILYFADGRPDHYTYSRITPNHVFIDPEIIANAPEIYLWAGSGDALSKHYESSTSARGQNLEYSDAMGVVISKMSAEPLLKHGIQAMKDCHEHKITRELEEVILSIIVATGLTANYAQFDFSTGPAHAVYSGLLIVPEVKANHHLHGELVSYGILLLLLMDKRLDEFERVYKFNRGMKLPTRLADIDVKPEHMQAVAEESVKFPDIRTYPYKITPDMIVKAMQELEEYDAKTR